MALGLLLALLGLSFYCHCHIQNKLYIVRSPLRLKFHSKAMPVAHNAYTQKKKSAKKSTFQCCAFVHLLHTLQNVQMT